jgi:hypothetical protein
MTDKDVLKVNGPTDPSLRPFRTPIVITIARNDISQIEKIYTITPANYNPHCSAVKNAAQFIHFHNTLHDVFLSGSNQWYIIQ